MNLARNATFAAMIATMWAVCATASPIATIEGTNLIRALGTDRETLTLVPTETSVEVGESGNGLYQVSWSGHDGYGSGLAQEQIAGPPRAAKPRRRHRRWASTHREPDLLVHPRVMELR